MVDTGIGMSTEEVNNLFQNFSQADASITRKFGGTELGLSIAKRLATLMGGNLTVTSKKGEGSTFIFTIKSKPIRSTLVAASNTKITGKDLAPDWSNKRILIAEDNRINQIVDETSFNTIATRDRVLWGNREGYIKSIVASTSLVFTWLDKDLVEVDTTKTMAEVIASGSLVILNEDY